LSSYELASANMAQMKNLKLQWRVIDATKTVMARFWGEMDPDRALEILLTRPRSLPEKRVCHDGTLVKQRDSHERIECHRGRSLTIEFRRY